MNEMILLAALIGLISISSSIVPTLAGTNQIFDHTCTNTPNDRKVDCFPKGNATKNACTSKGCCWQPTTLGSKEPWCFYHRQEPVCANILDEEKFDCYPRGIANEISCHKLGCCWEKKQDGSKEPWCFYPRNFRSYRVPTAITKTSQHKFILQAIKPYDYRYPNTIERARVEINSETKSRLRITITDDTKPRFKPPYPQVPVVDNYSEDTDYEVIVNEDPFGFAVVRKSSKTVIFDTRGVGGLVLSDQFLQISALLPTKYLYGLGERRNNFLINTFWEHITLFNHDALPEDNINLYGSHPFYLAVEKDGSSYGIFLLNTNAMDIIIQPAPAITYRTIGGNLDFYFFLGPTPADVIRQYLEVIGNPIFPPYWSFGFQISKWGWDTLKHTEEAYERTRKAQIPLDVVWNDIDYMDGYNDFTINTTTFKGLDQFVDKLHKDGLKYVVILDPGVAYNLPRGQYPPYDEAIEQNLLITNSSGLPSVGEVWNRPIGTVFPDFSNPKTGVYWCKLIKELYNRISFDGLWLDMNDISNFKDGSVYGCPANSLDNPPYTPEVRGGRLNYKTLCMSDKHAIGSHYDVHNIFALLQCITTNQCLQDLTKKRPFILSRSTFAGSGHYAAHWTGDVYSNWDSLKHSVADILNFNLFGIPMVGADICGFFGDTTVELCQRWSQLGAFYPFSRNHNAISAKDQDPASMGSEELINSTRKAVSNKYRYLPYLYTLFWRAHKYGETVIRPLFFDFPSDQNTLRIDSQFMWGPSILIVPVLTQGATSVNAFFPKAIWYNLDDPADKIDSIGNYRQIPAPMDTIPFFLRAGSIIPWQGVKSTTSASRQTNFGLDVALDQNGQANGTLFWDDGETFGKYEFYGDFFDNGQPSNTQA